MGDAMSALTEELIEGKTRILEAWRKTADPSQDTGTLSARQGKGRFSNPAAYHAAEGWDDIITWLAADEEADVPASVEELCRVKAVQDAAPSAALAFLFDLKPAIRSVVGATATEADLRALDARIDALALHAFDCYAACRNRIAQLRVDEVQRGEKMLRRQLERIQRNGEEPA